MKVQKLDCSKCKKETSHIKRSDQSAGETLFFGILTMGLGFAGRQFWWECTTCKNKIHI